MRNTGDDPGLLGSFGPGGYGAGSPLLVLVEPDGLLLSLLLPDDLPRCALVFLAPHVFTELLQSTHID